MTRFWSFFIEKSSFTILIGTVLILGGIYAVFAIPKESSPAIQIPIGIITTTLPGASANDVERLVTNKIETRVLSVEHVSKVTSSSGNGISNITVQFDANADIDTSIQTLKNEVDKAKPDLPTEAGTPSVTSVNFADQPILVASISGNLAPAELTALGQIVKDDLGRLPGVSHVDLSGVRARTVQVIVKQALLRQYNLSLSDVTSAIQASGVASPEGSIVVDTIAYSVRLEAGLTSPEEVGNVAITGPGGTSLHVRDIADVEDSLADPSTLSRVSVAGAPSEPALTVSVYKNGGGNVVAIANSVKDELTTLQKTTLSGTKIVYSVDAAQEVGTNLDELVRAGAETVGLVMIVLLLTLGWREALVAAASVPLSFLIAFIGLYFSGNTINFISLFALILAIGILVDSGIVVVEAFHTHLVRDNEGKKSAAISAIREYAWPLVAGTFTTVAVFVPLFFLSGIVGKFLASIPFTVIFVLIASIFVALGLVPLIAIFFIRPEQSSMELRQEAYNTRLKTWYQRMLTKMLANTRAQNYFLIGMAVMFVLVLTLPSLGLVKVDFFPADTTDVVTVQIVKPQGSVLNETDLSTREVEELLYADPRVKSFVTDIGEGSALGGTGGAGSQIANITVNLKSKNGSDKVIDDFRKEFSNITSAVVTASAPANGPSSGAPVSVNYSGDDLAALTETVEKAAQVMKSIPGATDVTTSAQSDSAEFVVSLDSEKAVEQGVSPLVVASTLRTALYGTKATTLRSGTNDIDVNVKLDLNPAYKDPSQTTYTNIDSVRQLTVPSPNGPIPLSSIASITFAPAETTIAHEDGKRIVTISADVAKGANAQQVNAEFLKRMNAVALPPGVSLTVEGDAQSVNQSFTEMFIALIAGIALMLCILVLEFNSFRQSFYLLLMIPLSLIGVFIGLAVTGSALSLTSMLGVIALAGVIINHAIILMDSISRIGRSHPGESLTEVVVEAASTRLRPIILTTITTVVGMIPLSLVSATWGPLAFAIMFGLSFSLLLTLLFIPIIYTRWPGKKVRAQFPQ